MSASPLTPEQLLRQAEAAEAAGNLPQALTLAQSACAATEVALPVLSGAARIAELARDHQHAAEWYGRAHAILPSKNLKFAQAREMMKAQNLAGAEAELRMALQRSPKEFQFLNLLGVTLKNAGRLEEALEWLAKASKVNATNNSPLVNMGNCHMALGAPARAAECFQRAIKLQPAHPENYRLLGRALAEQNQTDKAIAQFKAALQRGSRDPNVYMDLAFWF
jgi:tetratricopeptide (TPR) repeat protein